MEAECPYCYAMNNISERENYELVKCWACEKESELLNGDLIDINEKEEKTT